MPTHSAVLALVSLLGVGAPVGPSLAGPVPAAPEAAPFRIGRLQAYALRDAENVAANDGKTFGVGVDPAETGRVLAAAGAPTDLIRVDVDALLVRAPGRTMLFDTGLGPRLHGALLASLAKAGVEPAQVTDVFITHAHGDHVGGLAALGGRQAFPNALLHMSVREWDWMRARTSPSPLVAVISPQVRAFQPGAEVAPGVTAVALYGHTPGHCGYLIRSGGASLLDVGDVVHSSIISLGRPQWTVQYDQDADVGRTARIAELKVLADDGQVIFAPHFPFPGVGRIEVREGGYRWRPGLPSPP